MNGVYLGENRVLVETCFRAPLVVPANDLSLTPMLITTGTLEAPLTNFFLKSVKPGETAFDIGAHLGYFTVLLGFLVGASGRVFAFEANPEIYAFLRDNVAINWLEQTEVRHVAVSSEEATITLHVSKRFSGNTSVNAHDAAYFRAFPDETKPVQVPAAPLREYVDRVDQIDWLKIDIEGGEYHAFLGMKEMLTTRFIKNVVFELNRPMAQDNYEPFADLMREIAQARRASFYVLNDEGEPAQVELEALLAHGSIPFVLMR